MQSSRLTMDTSLATLSIFSNNDTLELEQIDNVICLDDVSNSKVENEFNTANIDGELSLKTYFEQPVEPSYIHSSTQEEFKNESMESMPCDDGSHYTAAVSSLYSDNFKEIDLEDLEGQIFQNWVDPNNFLELLDEKFSQASQKEIQEYLDTQEEVIVEEYLKDNTLEIIASNQDINQSFNTEQTDKKFERIEKEVLEDIYKCKHCELSFKTIQKLKKHIKQHSNKHNFQQNIPEKSKCLISNSSDDQSDDDSPIPNYWAPAFYLCKICNKYYKSNEAMLEHLIIHHTSSKTCIECRISFNYTIRLKKHMNTHKEKLYKKNDASSEYLYPCDKCDKVLKSKFCQKMHMQLHSGKRLFNCAYCNKTFAYSGSLRKHVRKHHTGENRYACPVCPKGFEQKNTLFKHVQKLHCSLKRGADHRRLDFHKCQSCRDVFGSSLDLFKHLMKRSDENTAKFREISPSLPKQQNFVLEDDECSTTFSTVLNNSSRLNPIVNDSDNADEPEDLKPIEKLNLSKAKTKPNYHNQSVFTAPDYKHLWNLNNVNQVKYYRPNNIKFDINEDVILKSVIDDCLIEDEPMFSFDNVEEVCTDMEWITEEMVPIFSEYCVDSCKDRK